MEKIKKKLLLENIMVFDFSRILVGSFASMMLADLGANVIKIESLNGDETREWGPPFIKENYSSYYASLNRNKKSICIDLKKAESKLLVERIASKADIILENFPVGKSKVLNLDYEEIKKINSNVIYASINGFGHYGDLKSTPAFDFIIQAYSGIMGITGEEKPYRVGFPICDILTSHQLYSAILTGLLHRKIHNEGQLIKTSLLECSLFSNPTITSAYLNGGKISKLIGNDHPNIAPYTIFKLNEKDSIALGVALNTQYDNLISILFEKNIKTDKIENNLYDHDKFKTNKLRVENREELKLILQDYIFRYIKKYGENDLFKQFDIKGIPYSKINSMKDIFEENKQIKDLNIVEKAVDNEKLKFVKFPVEFEKTEITDIKSPPNLGQNTDEIMEFLGFSKNEINSLKEKSVIK